MAIVAIYDRTDRAFACRLIERATPGTRVEILPPRSSDPQRNRMWALLADISKQYEHNGRYYSPRIWKALMLQACGQEVLWVQTLDGDGVIPFGGSTKRMGAAETNELLAFIEAWGAQHGVKFKGLD